MSFRPAMVGLAIAALTGCVITDEPPAGGTPTEARAVTGEPVFELPLRMQTGAIQDVDRSGDIRPEAAAILDYLASPERAATVSVADLRKAGLARSEVANVVATPATIRVWRRAVDGSSDSCSGRVDEIPFEKYVRGVLPHEWIPSWDAEALKAGAVAIRTYAAAWVVSGGKYDCADLDDTTASQVYKDDFQAATDAAVKATEGVYVVKDGELVFAEYSAENGDPTAFGVDEPLCSGQPLNGHGRGTCQWGTQRWASQQGKTYDWIVTHYYPGASLQGTNPTYDAAFTGANYPEKMVSGDEAVVWFEFQNKSNVTWDLDKTRLGTAEPNDRESAFYVEENWMSPSRTTGADHSNYGPGQTGRFTFSIRAPQVDSTTSFTEKFQLVQEGEAWFGPVVSMDIEVSPSAGGDPGTDAGPGEKTDVPSLESASLTGGCQTSGSRGGGAGGWALLGLGGAALLLGRKRRRAAAAVASLAATLLLVPACQMGPLGDSQPATVHNVPAGLGGSSELRPMFIAAAREFDIPAQILATISYVDTRLTFVGADVETDNRPVYGLMALTDGAPRDINHAAELLGVSREELATDPETNILGAAALLAELAEGRELSTLSDWAPVIAEFSGGGEAGHGVASSVMKKISLGWQGIDDSHHILVLSARATGEVEEAGIGQTTLGVGYPGSIWNPAYSGNYSNANRSAGDVDYIVIHTTQGSYGGTVNWFKNPDANVSAHYVVKSSNGEITHMVDGRDIAWHVSCFNTHSIGIEHEGFVADPGKWYTEAMYKHSAQLTAWLAKEWGVPVDRNHIIGHGETTAHGGCSDHTDPGSGWNWSHYMDLVRDGGKPTYGASFVNQDAPTAMLPGDEIVVWFEFKNDSNVTWDLDKTRLGTTMPDDHPSPFYVDGNWLNDHRATGADHSNYAPGATGRFTFLIRAPEVTETTTFTEHFRLVQEGEAWFGPVVTMEITVMAPGDSGDMGGDPSGGDPTDPGTGEMGGDPGDPGPTDPGTGDTGTTGTGDEIIPDNNAPLAGGCQIWSATGDQGGAPWLAYGILAAGVVLIYRRRRMA